MNRRMDTAGRLHLSNLELAARSLDEMLTPTETSQMQTHVAACPTCARRIMAMRADARVLSAPPAVVPSARVDSAIRAAIEGRPTRPNRLLLVATAALLLLAAIAAGAVGAALLRTFEPLPVTLVPEPVPAPSARVASSQPPGEPTQEAGEAWTTLDHTDPAPGELIETATFAGADLVGAGRGRCLPDLDTPTICYGGIWIGPPGEDWTPVLDGTLEVSTSVVALGPPKGIVDIAAGPAGIVAIGDPYDGRGPGVWHSLDGRSWRRVGLGPRDIDSHVLAVAAGPAGFAIVGRTIDFAGPSARATSWASPDGITWNRAVDAPAMDVGPCLDTGGEPTCGGMLGVVGTETGYVAVGAARSNAGQRSRPAAWSSRNGRDWTRSDPGLEFEGSLSGVARGGPGLVAIGLICEPTCTNAAPGVAAISADGASWAFQGIPGSSDLHEIAGVGGGRVFAIGAPGLVPEPPAELQLWRSDDGVTWQLVEDLPSIPEAVGFGAADIAADGDRLVVAGWAELAAGAGYRNFVHVSPPTRPSAPVSIPATPSDVPAAPSEPRSSKAVIPRCPAPKQVAEPPTVVASTGDQAGVAATRGSYTTMTCSTTGVSDVVPTRPDQPLLVRPGDTLTLTVPGGWRFVRWKGYDTTVVGEGGNVWIPTELPHRPHSIELPLPLRPGESIFGLTVVLITDDERTIVELSLQVLVDQIAT